MREAKLIDLDGHWYLRLASEDAYEVRADLEGEVIAITIAGEAIDGIRSSVGRKTREALVHAQHARFCGADGGDECTCGLEAACKEWGL